MRKLRPQYGVNTLRLLEVQDKPRPALPLPYQHWVCPNCEMHTPKAPIDLEFYECLCGWHGDRDQLLCAEIPDAKS